MPTAALRPCSTPGCPVLVAGGRCPSHAAPPVPRPNQDVRRWYATVRWFRLRRLVLADAAHTCAVCQRVEASLDIDHIRPHGGDPDLFWDLDNLQALCKPCHSQKTNRGG